MAKIKTQGKLHDPKTIYVSWFVDEPTNKVWVDQFCLKVSVATGGAARPCTLRWTGDELAGDLHGSDDPLSGATDIVAVVTDAYLHANQDDQRSAQERELARFIALRLQDEGDSEYRRAWLTPLQKTKFARVVVGGLRLSEDRFWLVRLKKDGERFELPPSPVANDEIYEAVETILGDMDEAEG